MFTLHQASARGRMLQGDSCIPPHPRCSMHFLPAHDPRLEISFPLISVQWLQIYTTNKHLLSPCLGPVSKQQISSMWYMPKIPPKAFDCPCNTGKEKTQILLMGLIKLGQKLCFYPYPNWGQTGVFHLRLIKCSLWIKLAAVLTFRVRYSLPPALSKRVISFPFQFHKCDFWSFHLKGSSMCSAGDTTSTVLKRVPL